MKRTNKKNERIGEINYNTNGDKMTIIEYIDANNIIVLFENGYTIKSAYREFKSGKIKNPNTKPENRVGEINYNTYGSKMIIIEYKNADDITVQFSNGYIVKSAYKEFKNGNIKNPYDKTVYGVGYFGEGEYKGYINKQVTNQYRTWINMFTRCYNDKELQKHPTYTECEVCEEWHNFQVFAKWYDKNFYQIEEQKMNLDKDILHKNNKIYSPENCVFVPQCINKLFVKCDSKRGEYPIGVTFEEKADKFRAGYENGKGKIIFLGYFLTSKEAFNSYKKYKEKLIKEIANEYKDRIPSKLYEAMINYKVEITD